MLPDRFLWGASSSSFQFEMGDRYRRNIDVNSDWWHWVRDPSNLDKGLVSGDLPEDGVNYAELYPLDHELARSLGLNTYRIHVEWSRVFPCSTRHIEVSIHRDGSGLIKHISMTLDDLHELDKLANQREIRKYRAMINDLREKGFKVIVNLQHFTLPVWLHDPIRSRDTNLEKGPRGVIDEDFIIEFTKFTAYTAWKLGDLVDVWSIYNEPMVIIELGYMAPFLGFPPGVHNTRAAAVGLRNIIVAYARAYDAIKKWDSVEAGDWGVGSSMVGIIHNIIPAYPLDPERDYEASEAYNYFHNSLILDAWSRGLMDYHLDGNRDKLAHLGGRVEWIGLNYYTRIVAKYSDRAPEGIPILKFEGVGGYGYACVPNELSKTGRPCDDFGWEMFPEGFYDAIRFVSQYNVPVYVTENGTADARDYYRPRYIVSHIRALEHAVDEGYRVDGYMHWALTDNYEWARGFRLKFGLFSVDLVTKERMPRQSAKIYSQIIKNNGVPQSLLDLSIWDRVVLGEDHSS